MGNSKKPQQDHEDNNGVPDDDQPQAQVHSGQDRDGDGLPEDEARIGSNPVIINR